MNKQKKIAVINDFSGYGRCSLTVSIPIISASGIQCCPVPTAIFSNHTGYNDYFFDDYTDKMRLYYSKWEKLGLKFNGIYSGFLGSERQVEIVEEFIKKFSLPETIIIIDPVMGDNGRIYATLTRELCKKLRQLAAVADILTPNITEACILTGTSYNEYPDEKTLLSIAHKLISIGSKNIVITGIRNGSNSSSIGNFIFKQDGSYKLLSSPAFGNGRAGTGDVFASVIAADAVNGDSLEKSVVKAAKFVSESILLSDEQQLPSQDGLCFEGLLGTLLCNSDRKL